MNTDSIDAAFEKLISERGIYKKLEVSENLISQLRYKLKNDIGISTDAKIKLLQKSGWKQDNRTYSKDDMIDFVKFYNKTSQAARDQGYEYVLEKWEAKK